MSWENFGKELVILPGLQWGRETHMSLFGRQQCIRWRRRPAGGSTRRTRRRTRRLKSEAAQTNIERVWKSLMQKKTVFDLEGTSRKLEHCFQTNARIFITRNNRPWNWNWSFIGINGADASRGKQCLFHARSPFVVVACPPSCSLKKSKLLKQQFRIWGAK